MKKQVGMYIRVNRDWLAALKKEVETQKTDLSTFVRESVDFRMRREGVGPPVRVDYPPVKTVLTPVMLPAEEVTTLTPGVRKLLEQTMKDKSTT